MQKGAYQLLQPHTCLFAVAVSAKRLPVVFVPEKNWIAAMRNDVIDHGCRCELSSLPALDAQRMLTQESCSGISPFTVISTFSGASAQPIRRIIRMIIAINTMITQIGTSRKPAGAFWTSGHISPQMKSSPRSSYTELPVFRFFIALSNAMTKATAPSTFSVERSLSIFRFPAGSVRT